MWRLLSRLAAAAGVVAAVAAAPGPAHALTYGTTTFDGYNAAIDQSTGLAWVSPTIAASDTYANLSALCPGGACTGALAGLTWASDSQVNVFFRDIGIPLSTFTESYSAIGTTNNLGGLISFLGPIYTQTLLTGHTDYLGGITNDPLVLDVPNTSYMFHFYDSTSSIFDNESAFTFGAGNGYAELPATFGWFYFTPSRTSVPEPGSLAILGTAVLLIGMIRTRRRHLSS